MPPHRIDPREDEEQIVASLRTGQPLAEARADRATRARWLLVNTTKGGA